MKPKTSDVWQYFAEIDNDLAKCKVCHRNYSRKGRTTTSLKSHLKSMHKEIYAEICRTEVQREIEKANQLPSSVPVLQQARNQMWDSSHVKAKKMDNLIGEMIALQNLPLNFVEGIGFRRVMQTAWPNYELRGSDFFTELLCGEMYSKMSIKVKQMLKQFPKLSLTANIWSEPCANSSFLSLTAHGIGEDFSRIQIVLESGSPYDRHIGDDIWDHFKEMQSEWSILDIQIHCYIHDGVSNFIRTPHLASINCTVHQLQACLRSALENCEVKGLITKCKMIYGHFMHSQIALYELIEIQRELLQRPAMHVFQDCGTKWNSTFLMLEQLLKIQDSLYIYASNHNIPHITPEECLYLRELVALLNPFEEIITNLNAKKTCISSVIPLIHSLKYTLLSKKNKSDTKQNLKNFIMKIIDDINSRFCDLENNFHYSLATYLDPRYKSKFFNEITKEHVLFELLRLLTYHETKHASKVDEASDYAPKRFESDSMDNKPGTSFQTLPPTQTVNSNLMNLLQDSSDEEVAGDDNTSNSNLIKWSSLIKEYNKEKRLQLNEDPLMWWKNNTRFHVFAPIVRAYLSPSTGSISKEDLFIEAGLNQEPLRHGLDAAKAAKLMFVKYNLPLMGDSK